MMHGIRPIKPTDSIENTADADNQDRVMKGSDDIDTRSSQSKIIKWVKKALKRLSQYWDDHIEDRKIRKKTIRPWVRYWARMIDMTIWGFLLVEAIKMISISTYWFLLSSLFGYAINLLIYISWIFIEAFLISCFGYTFGKWLLKIQVRKSDGMKLGLGISIKRALNVSLFGMGLGIWLLTILDNIISYQDLRYNGQTKWDYRLDTKVKHSRIGLLRCLIAVVFILIPVILFFIENYEPPVIN